MRTPPWLDCELEAAVRSKAVLAVEILMPDGTVRELQLEASGLGGGRLRGRDRAADVDAHPAGQKHPIRPGDRPVRRVGGARLDRYV